MKNMLDSIKMTKLEFIEKINEAKDTVTFKFRIPENFSWSEGTHLHMAFKGFEKEMPPNPKNVKTFSIMSIENEYFIGITTRINEECSEFKKRLMMLEAGDEMLAFKIGNRMALKREDQSLVMISMGVGIATIRPAIKRFHENPKGIKKLININVDSSGDAVYRAEIEKIEDEKFINYFVKSRKDLYEKIDHYLLEEGAFYYVVGSEDFMTKICEYLTNHGIEKKKIIIDVNEKKRENIL